jgi:hypothetical protein
MPSFAKPSRRRKRMRLPSRRGIYTASVWLGLLHQSRYQSPSSSTKPINHLNFIMRFQFIFAILALASGAIAQGCVSQDVWSLPSLLQVKAVILTWHRTAREAPRARLTAAAIDCDGASMGGRSGCSATSDDGLGQDGEARNSWIDEWMAWEDGMGGWHHNSERGWMDRW